MPIENALISQSMSHLVTARAKNYIRNELDKGCRSEIFPRPVPLEPPFSPLWKPNFGMAEFDTAPVIELQAVSPKDVVRLQIWVSPEQPLEWVRCELFLKQLQCLSFQVGFEIYGNSEKIVIGFVCHRFDLPVLQAAFLGNSDYAP